MTELHDLLEDIRELLAAARVVAGATTERTDSSSLLVDVTADEWTRFQSGLAALDAAIAQ